MQDLKITLVQADLSWENPQENLRNFGNKLTTLADKPDLIILPEMFSTGFAIHPEKVAETMDGTTFHWLKDKAAELNAVITGSIIIKEKDRFYNRLVWMRPDGSYECYDKHHLFRLGGEHLKFDSGNNHLVIELKGWKIRPLICYDLRFPVWSKNTFSNGNYEYDCLIYVAHWPARRNFAWKSLLVARAIENQAYLAGVNRVGNDNQGIPHSGDSVILDFRGHVLKEAKPDTECMITQELSYSQLADFRNDFTVGLDWDSFSLK